LHVLDADQTAREVVAAGTDGLAEIVRNFGDDVLLQDGELDRKKLGAIIFGDPDKRELLNSIVHPRVISAQNDWIEKLEKSDPNGIAVIDAALMIESGGYKRFPELIVVWCEPEIQLERLMRRDHLSEGEAKQRVAAQMPQEEKKRFADHLIDTSGSFDETHKQTLQLVETLRKRGKGKDGT
jgi:dephospho-CoA kinase